MSFDLTNLHTLIVRAHHQRDIAIGKVMRVSLQAAADRKFALRNHSGSRLELNQAICDFLRRYAAEAEAQDRPRWWTRKPWSELRHLFVNEAEFGPWLDRELGASRPKVHVANQTTERRSSSPRELALKALQAIFGHRVPDRAGKTDQQLCGEVEDWLKDDRNWSEGETKRKVSRDTILRAAGRRLT
jgi:hypothetical protein